MLHEPGPAAACCWRTRSASTVRAGELPPLAGGASAPPDDQPAPRGVRSPGAGAGAHLRPFDRLYSKPVRAGDLSERMAELGDNAGFIEFTVDETEGLIRVYTLAWSG